MESSAQINNNIRLATEEDLPRVLELSRMWPESFIDESISAIESDFGEHHCCVYEVSGNVEAFVVFCTTYYEIEMLWAATNRNLRYKTAYLWRLHRWIEKTYFESVDHYRIMVVKMASLDSSIEHAPEFSGMASRGIQKLVARLGYCLDIQIDSYWFPGDHCVLALKKKHQDE